MQVFLIAATTIDGFIARHEEDRSFDWTSQEDKDFYISKIKQSDAIIMGSTSFSTFKKHPRNTNWYIYTKNPNSFINPSPSVISAQGTNENPSYLIERLKKEGKKNIAICGGKSIYSQFLESGEITKIYLTIEPFIFGTGVKLFDKPHEKRLKLDNITKLSEASIVLEYSTT